MLTATGGIADLQMEGEWEQVIDCNLKIILSPSTMPHRKKMVKNLNHLNALNHNLTAGPNYRLQFSLLLYFYYI